MSVIVYGMEMPTNEPLIVKINPDGSVSTTWKNDYKKYKAVPIPPHGRLIDADALSDDLITKTVHIEAAGSLLRMVRAAPTIIEAEDGT